MNSISIIGRLTADPELRTTRSGTPVASFTLAVDRPYVNNTTDFFSCVAWRKTGELICQYYAKGRKMGVTGYMQSRKYEDKDGNKRTAWEVVVNQFDFCDDKRPEGSTDNWEPADVDNWEPADVDDGELPF